MELNSPVTLAKSLLSSARAKRLLMRVFNLIKDLIFNL